MLKAIIFLVALSSGVSSYSGDVAKLAKDLPPRPEQGAIECHNNDWLLDNTVVVGGFRLQKKLAPFVDRALQDSKTIGNNLEINSAYRSCPEQQQLRISACGVGDYNLYHKPIDLCLPPTEPAGKSLHNEALAVDFKCGGYNQFSSSPCLTWLRKNGYKYHLYEHRLEPWHWSTTSK